MSNPFVPTDEIQKLLNGSYEQLSARVYEAVQAEADRLWGDEDVEFRLLATFDGKAVVVSEDARFMQVSFEKAESGELVIVGNEFLPVEVYDTKDRMEQFARKEALALAEAFIRGERKITDRVKDLAQVVDGRVFVSDREWAAAKLESIRFERPWRKWFAEEIEKGTVYGVLGESWENWDPPESKFHRLYNGSLDDALLDGYRGLVRSDLTNLGEKLTGLAGQVEHTVASLASLVDTHEALASNQEIRELQSRMSEYVADVNEARQVIADSLAKVGSVDSLGQLFDSLTVAFNTFEKAGEFFTKQVETIASKL